MIYFHLDPAVSQEQIKVNALLIDIIAFKPYCTERERRVLWAVCKRETRTAGNEADVVYRVAGRIERCEKN